MGVVVDVGLTQMLNLRIVVSLVLMVHGRMVVFVVVTRSHPEAFLSDNALVFSAQHRHGMAGAFEVELFSLGINSKHSRPYHPQTLGKLERFHRTMKEWLEDRHPAETAAELQVSLDVFRDHYNQDRPHQGLGDATPAERYQRGPGRPTSRPPVEGQPAYPPGSIVRKVDRAGVIGYRRASIGVGKRWRHLWVRVVDLAGVTHIYFGEELVRSLVLDPDTKYQGSTGIPRPAKTAKTPPGSRPGKRRRQV
jgi:hypothetical protein